MTIQFHFLPAGSGDSILIQSDDFIILVDSGDIDSEIAEELYRKLKTVLKDRKINWIILTHIDDDHIGGMTHFLSDESFLLLLASDCKVWMNYPDGKNTIFLYENNSNLISYIKADKLKSLVEKKLIIHVDNICIENYSQRILAGEYMYLEVISPSSKKLEKLTQAWKPTGMVSGRLSDYKYSLAELSKKPEKSCSSIPNGSSIAFILTYLNDSGCEQKFLFLADSHTGVIRSSLLNKGYCKDNPLVVEFIKVSHHGSMYNTSKKLLDLIASENFVFLTNDECCLPHKQTIERIINRRNSDNLKTNLIFNYECSSVKLKRDKCILSSSASVICQDFFEY